MEGSGGILLDTEKVEQGFNVLIDKLSVAIVYDLSRKSMVTEDLVSKDLHESFCGKLYMCGFELDILGELINNNENSVVSI